MAESSFTRRLRQRLTLRDEFVLALLPTLTVLGVLLLVELLTEQRLLFASLAASAFLIYLDPHHSMNSVRTLVLAQGSAALLGLGSYLVFGAGYLAGGVAMLAAITLMIMFDIVHPPATATALSFAFRSGAEASIVLFGLALAIIAVLVVLERVALWQLARMHSSART
jgi:CBS-domain-containing membrane protein